MSGRLARSWGRWLIDILLIAGGVVSLIVEPLSIAIHSVVGLVFVGTVGPHLWHRRRWIAGVLTRLRRPGGCRRPCAGPCPSLRCCSSWWWW
jgi:hypothetical protein